MIPAGSRHIPPAPGPAHHRITTADFADLAQGSGGPTALAALTAGQRSRSMLLLRALIDLTADHPQLPGPLPDPRAAWELLLRAERRCAPAVDRLLLHPQFGTWRDTCLRRLRGRGPAAGELWLEVGHLHAAVAAAALLAGLDFRITVPVREGGVMLPALGLAHLGADAPPTAEVSRDPAGRCTVRAGRYGVRLPADLTRDAPGWAALRRLHTERADRADRAPAPFLDDLDPYRDFLRRFTAPERLSGAEAGRWQRDFARAWALIAEQTHIDPGGLAACLTSIVPVRYPNISEPFSASSPASFGCALVSPPADPETFAASLVHEAQHIKLSALLDLVPLITGGLEEIHYAPWRADPRPLRGILQGVYAFLGVTGFWHSRIHRAAEERGRQAATFEFALRRAQTAQGIATLRRHADLTRWGRRFLDGVADRLDHWLAEPVPATLGRTADELCADHRVLHRLHHLRPDPAELDRWARTWRQGRHAPDTLPRATVHADRYAVTARPALARQRITDPAGSAAPRDGVAHRGDLLARADRDWAHHDPAAALRGYRAHLARHPDSTTAWAGLALTLPDGAAGTIMRRRPEVVLALHRALRETGSRGPDPVALAHWAGAALMT